MDIDSIPYSSPPSSAADTPSSSSSAPSPPSQPQPYTFTTPPAPSLPAAASLEYLTRAAFLAVQSRPVPRWMAAHVAPNFRSDIDSSPSPDWASHVEKFRLMAERSPATHRITNLVADVDEAKAHADVLCHMEATDRASGIRRLGLAQLRWKRHPADGRWQLVHIMGMREPPSDLHGDLAGEGGGF